MNETIHNGGHCDKTEAVRTMFDNIAHRYDFLNHFLSAGIDRRWRKRLVGLLSSSNPSRILDVATGTADLAIAAAAHTKAGITGVDISTGMLRIGNEKLERHGLADRINLLPADSMQLPFADNDFDAVMVAFGVRNFSDLQQGLREMRRVIKPGSRAFILEFSKPRTFPVKQLYAFYFNRLLPSIGRIVSRDRSAYTYLPDSVASFPDGKDFEAVMRSAGFKGITTIQLTFGIASIYIGEK
jgi:demethylmenaquinone methyltransferase/2-methoxy-6-polyprenyl-1,4-benzoquinol methylase